MITILLLSVLGAVIAAVIGTVWYSMKTPMGRIHLASVGFDKLSPEEQKKKMEEAKPMMQKLYAGQILLSLLTSFAVVFIITMSMQNGLSFPMALGFVAFNWLCFVVPTIGSGSLWGSLSGKLAWQKFFSDISSNLITIIVIALITWLFV